MDCRLVHPFMRASNCFNPQDRRSGCSSSPCHLLVHTVLYTYSTFDHRPAFNTLLLFTTPLNHLASQAMKGSNTAASMLSFASMTGYTFEEPLSPSFTPARTYRGSPVSSIGDFANSLGWQSPVSVSRYVPMPDPADFYDQVRSEITVYSSATDEQNPGATALGTYDESPRYGYPHRTFNAIYSSFACQEGGIQVSRPPSAARLMMQSGVIPVQQWSCVSHGRYDEHQCVSPIQSEAGSIMWDDSVSPGIISPILRGTMFDSTHWPHAIDPSSPSGSAPICTSESLGYSKAGRSQEPTTGTFRDSSYVAHDESFNEPPYYGNLTPVFRRGSLHSIAASRFTVSSPPVSNVYEFPSPVPGRYNAVGFLKEPTCLESGVTADDLNQAVTQTEDRNTGWGGFRRKIGKTGQKWRADLSRMTRSYVGANSIHI